ncbi:hypothetical protein GCM10009527_083490 [Actinomadura nitritigenes]
MTAPSSTPPAVSRPSPARTGGRGPVLATIRPVSSGLNANGRVIGRNARPVRSADIPSVSWKTSGSTNSTPVITKLTAAPATSDPGMPGARRTAGTSTGAALRRSRTANAAAAATVPAAEQAAWTAAPEPSAMSASVNRPSVAHATAWAGQSMVRSPRGQRTRGPATRARTRTASGTLIRKIARQPASPTRAPPAIGPAASAAPLVAAQAATAFARSAGTG